MDYGHIHEKWQKFWVTNNTNKFDPKSKQPKYYTLNMFPYPSGANLHLGHYYHFALSDTHARYKHMNGFNVFQPMGFDAFGLPAENHALKTNTHPHDNTVKNMQIMQKQFEQMGCMYDWDYGQGPQGSEQSVRDSEHRSEGSYTLTTCFPDYYKWTQWLFLQLFNAGLAYQKEAPVN